MLKKAHRLAKTKDVKRALGRGRAFFNPLFTLKFIPTPNAGKRFTVIVSTKVSKKAVSRNRIKRVIREYIRLRLEKFTSGDYALIVKPFANKAEEKMLLRSLDKLFKDARLIK